MIVTVVTITIIQNSSHTINHSLFIQQLLGAEFNIAAEAKMNRTQCLLKRKAAWSKNLSCWRGNLTTCI